MTGVGHEEEALASVGRADVGGGDDAAFHAIPGGVEVGDNSVQPARNEGRNVFDDDRAGAQFFDDPEVLAPEAGPGTVKAGAFARDRYVLTGESATNHLHLVKVVRAYVAHVRVTLRVGPVHREHAATPGVKLDLPGDGAEPGPLQAKLKAADAGEERADHESVQAEQGTPHASQSAPFRMLRQADSRSFPRTPGKTGTAQRSPFRAAEKVCTRLLNALPRWA